MDYEDKNNPYTIMKTKHWRVWYYPPANLRVDICAPKLIDFGNQASPWCCFCQGRRGSCGSKCSRFATSLGLGTAKFKSHIGSVMTRQSTPLGLLELWKRYHRTGCAQSIIEDRNMDFIEVSTGNNRLKWRYLFFQQQKRARVLKLFQHSSWSNKVSVLPCNWLLHPQISH